MLYSITYTNQYFHMYRCNLGNNLPFLYNVGHKNKLSLVVDSSNLNLRNTDFPLVDLHTFHDLEFLTQVKRADFWFRPHLVVRDADADVLQNFGLNNIILGCQRSCTF